MYLPAPYVCFLTLHATISGVGKDVSIFFSSKEKCQRRERRKGQKDGMEERSEERREEVGGKGRKFTPNQTW